MAVTQSGISTLGVLIGYAIGSSSSKPLTFKALERANSVGGIELPSEKIDSSALEDYVTRYIAGRQDSGGEWQCVFNFTSETEAQLKEMIDAYNGRDVDGGEVMWFTVYSPQNTKAFFVIAQPPQVLPMPEMGQNELQTITVTFALEEYKGTDTAVKPTLS